MHREGCFQGPGAERTLADTLRRLLYFSGKGQDEPADREENTTWATSSASKALKLCQAPLSSAELRTTEILGCRLGVQLRGKGKKMLKV